MADEAKSCSRFFTVEEKQTIKDYLVKVKFLSPIGDVQCICCKEVALSHKIAPCQHVFCYECIKTLQGSRKSTCPEDDEDVCSDNMLQNPNLERMVYNLKITCPNETTFGCDKQLTIGTLLEHLDECKFNSNKMLPKLCPPENNSSQDNQEEMVSMAVVRELTLKIQQLEDQFARLDNDFKVLPASLENKLIKKFNNIETKMESTNRNNVEQITDIKTALRRVSITKSNGPTAITLPDQQNLSTIQKSLKTLQLASHGQYIWKVSDYTSKKRSAINRPDTVECSDSFYICRYGHNVQAFLYMNGYGEDTGRYLAVGLRTIPGEWDGLLPATPLLRCTFELLQQLEDGGKRAGQTEAPRRHIRFAEEPHFLAVVNNKDEEVSWGTSTFAPHELIEAPQAGYVKKNTLFVRITVEPVEDLEWPIGQITEGAISWSVSDFRQKKQDEVDGVCECQYSDYFFTSSRGYRLRLQLFLNGAHEAKGTHMSIFLGVLKGKYDTQLPDLFRHKVVYRLVDARDIKKFSSRKHLVMEDVATTEQDIVSRMSGYRGLSKWVALADIESPTSYYMRHNKINIEALVITLP